MFFYKLFAEDQTQVKLYNFEKEVATLMGEESVRY
jgi:hypothetical protein